MTLQSTFPLLDTVSPERVSAYLLRKGWQRVEYPNPNLLVFEPRTPGQENLSLVLPAKRELADYVAKVRDCVRMLSSLYDVDVQTVVQQISRWDRDVLSIRLDSPLQKEQLLPLNYASQIIAKYRDFVAFAAATEALPKRFFAKLTGAGREFVDACMFGHTFEGSFGLTIECPLGLTPELPLEGAPPPRPFQRAVTERIATGYADLATAVAKEDPEVIVNNHMSGFSGNMCDILVDIYDISTRRTIYQKMIWTPELPAPKHLTAIEEPVRLDQRSYEVLKAASGSLQTVDEPEEDKVIEGRITRLRSEKPPVNVGEFATASRTIVMQWEIENQQPINIHIELPLELYWQACDAHKNGKKIRILGKPVKVGKFWTLSDHRDLEVI